MPHVFNPKITTAGQAAAIAASNAGLELALTHIGFSTAVFNPTGAETSLTGEVVRLPISAGARITPTQVRISATWNANAGTKNINAVGFYAGSTLFAVWSSTEDGATPLAVKTDDVPFVLYYDFALSALPPDSITVVADTGQSITLLALNNHLINSNAHPQYQRIDGIANATDLMWCGTATGTGNALILGLPAGQIVPSHKTGLALRFKAASTNTGVVTVKVGALSVKNVTKANGVPLAPTDIVAGGIYELVYDGSAYQITGSAGGSAAAYTQFEFLGAGPHSVDYTVGSVEVFRNGLKLGEGDFVATDGHHVSVPSALSDDEVIVVAFSTFAVADAYTKSEVDYRLDNLPLHTVGHARLTLYSGILTLSRYMGKTIPINGVAREIPSAGVTIDSSYLSPDTTYYIYAAIVSDVMKLEAWNTPYVQDLDTGVMVRGPSADKTRTLVGIARTDGLGVWSLCRSWFNDSGFSLKSAFTADRSSLGATSYTEIHQEIRVPFLVWSGDIPVFAANGSIKITGASASFYSSIAIGDGVLTEVGSFTRQSSTNVNDQMPLSMTVSVSGLAEGYHYATIIGKASNGAVSGVYAGYPTSSGDRTTLEVFCHGNH